MLITLFLQGTTLSFSTRSLISLAISLTLATHLVNEWSWNLTLFLRNWSSSSNGLFLSQNKYAHDLLDLEAMVDSEPLAIPMVVGQHLSSVGEPFFDPSLYQSLVVALQYLTITMPDLSYSINMACQFMHVPTDYHFKVVKEILCYIKGAPRPVFWHQHFLLKIQ